MNRLNMIQQPSSGTLKDFASIQSPHILLIFCLNSDRLKNDLLAYIDR